MASIDDLFRKPYTSNKRKLEDPTANYLQHAKSAKLSNGASPRTLGTNGAKAATVHDEVDTLNNASDDEDDVEAGPSLPPEDLEDGAEMDADEEGRFFGGGVSKKEREVMDYINENEDTEAVEEKIDLSWLKRTALNFERKINKNAELRAKYDNDPLKFVSSEADLDAQIRELSLLCEHGELYADFVRSGCVTSLVGLLAHENSDIAIAACEVLEELTDEDVGVEEQQWSQLVQAMMDTDAADLLVSNLGRLNEAEEMDRAGIYHVLNVIENLCSESRNLEIFGDKDKFLEWLKTRIRTPDVDARAKVGQNRQYAAELLSILLSGNDTNRSRFAQAEGVELLLQLLSAYRKRDPEENSDEEEFVENLFACLASAVKDQTSADKFIEAEGVELLLIMVREGTLSKARALRVLDHALGGQRASAIGEHLVVAAGLKTLFSTFMKLKRHERELIEHMIGIFASLLRYLPAQSAARIRTMAKFVEKNYEKISRLVDLRRDYVARLEAADAQIVSDTTASSAEDTQVQEAERLSRRFDAGLFSLQTLDVVLAWLIAEDDGARQKIISLLGEETLKTLSKSLTEQLEGIDDNDGGKDTEDVLRALLRCLT